MSTPQTTVAAMRRLRANNLTFDVADSEEADLEPVLLLHGFPQDRTSWDQIVTDLRGAGYRTIAFDQRGYSPGARPSRLRDYRQGHMVDDAVAILDELGIDQAHVVGHDWGGAVAWAIASTHPGRVASLTVLSTPYPSAMTKVALRSTQLLHSWYMGLFQVPLLSTATLTPSGPFWRAALKGLPADKKARYTERARQPGALSAMLKWYRALPLDIARPSVDWHRISVPTLYIWGERDPALGRAAAEATQAYVTGPYTFLPLAGVGHWVPESAPKKVLAALLPHLGEHPTARR